MGEPWVLSATLVGSLGKWVGEVRSWVVMVLVGSVGMWVRVVTPWKEASQGSHFVPAGDLR